MRGISPQSRFKNLGTLTNTFGAPTEEGSKESAHMGIDIANKEGTPIPSVHDGVVTKVEGGHQQGDNNFGNTVEVQGNDGNTAQYHHLQSINVAQGDQVQEGQHIANMGKTGAVHSPSGGDPTHLDFRIVDAYGKYMNPLKYIKNL